MRKRLLYTAGILLLAISVTLVVWQGSFHFGELAPADPAQTFILWAVSTLVFLLMVTLAFILGRTAVKLYVDRRSNRVGSRIRTKLVAGALALTILPVIFLVLFSVSVLNRNLDKWFTRPAEAQRLSFVEVAEVVDRELKEKARIQAELLALQPGIRERLTGGAPSQEDLEQFCRQHGIEAASISLSMDGPALLTLGKAGSLPMLGKGAVMGNAEVRDQGETIGHVLVASKVPIDIAERQKAVERYSRQLGELASRRKEIRRSSLFLLTLITLFILFVATWLALFLSKQISIPISALLHAAGEVSKGNLSHQVEVRAIDELAGLVQAFNAMTRELDANGRELDARRRFTEAILESIPTGVISVSADGAIQRVNRALKQILPADRVAGATRLEDLFSRDDTAEIKYLMKRARRTGVAFRQVDLASNGQTRHLAVTVAALEEKLTSGFVMVLEDTSELLRAQKAAAWHEVARRIAHEIKNPLTPIALSAERISRQVDRLALAPDSARVLRECSAIISREVESVKTLVDEFSHFARFPAAQPVRCNLNEVVESALGVFAGRLGGIEIQSSLASDLPPVYLDPEQFKRVVVNLVDNAAEAMQESAVKQITIATFATGADSVELVVSDTGCGISPEDREKLFLPYFSTKGRGTGLGLAIVHHILAEHSAQIRVEENLPTGARFTIEMPALVESAEDVPIAVSTQGVIVTT